MSLDKSIEPDKALQAFLEHRLQQRVPDGVTAATNLWKHNNISDRIRDHAINMVGKDVYSKVKPAGDTRLFAHPQWDLATLVDHNNQLQYTASGQVTAVKPAKLAEVLRSVPVPAPGVRYVLSEEDKGSPAGPPPKLGLSAQAEQ